MSVEKITINKDKLVCPDCGCDVKTVYKEEQVVCTEGHYNDLDSLITIEAYMEGDVDTYEE